MSHYKLTDYRIRGFKQNDIALADVTTCSVWLSFAAELPASLGSSIEIALELPRNDDTTLSMLRKAVRGALPELLRAAADLAERHIPVDGSDLQSRDGLE